MRRATSLKTMLCLGAAFGALASPAWAQVSSQDATPIANTPTRTRAAIRNALTQSGLADEIEAAVNAILPIIVT